MPTTLLVSLSLLLQILAAMQALRLIWITGWRWLWPWALIASAIVLMVVRRSIALHRLLTEGVEAPVDLTAEWVALAISVLMLVGLAGITPLFRSIRHSELQARQARDRLEEAEHIAHLGSWTWDEQQQRSWWSDEMSRIFGIDPVQYPVPFPQFVEEFVHPEDQPRLKRVWEELSRGDSVEMDFRIVRRDGHLRHVRGRGRGFVNAHGELQRIVGTLQDITAQKRDEQRQTLMMRELDHRVKNTLAVVQSVVERTLQTSPSPQDFALSMRGRISAMARTHEALARQRWNGVELGELVALALGPILDTQQDGNRIRYDGPPLLVSVETAQPLAMALHELATNAVKHGSLRDPAGSLRVNWHIDYDVTAADRPAAWIVLQWTERGGPAIAQPPPRGYGIRLIDEGIAYQVGGQAQLNFESQGLTCEIRLPLQLAESTVTTREPV